MEQDARPVAARAQRHPRDGLEMDRRAQPVLRAVGLTKAFDGVLALAGADIDLHAGEIHALAGENGAGKSTFARLLSGAHSPDAGYLELDGQRLSIGSPSDGLHAGIAVIYQEPTLFPQLTVAENIFIGRQPRQRRFGWIDRRRMAADARAVLVQLGATLDPMAPTEGLSVAELQQIEMAGALSRGARVLVVDEPTASLTPAEVAKLFAILDRLRREGAAIVFIGHRLEELFRLADRITVLRDGRVVATDLAARFDRDRLIQAMVGREVNDHHQRRRREPGRPLLQVEAVARKGVFRDVSFEVRAGEIVSLAGLVGAGRSEVVRAVFGVDRLDAGRVMIDGRTVRIRHPRDAMRNGLALVPEDRQGQGLATDYSISRNLTLTVLEQVAGRIWVKQSEETRVAARWIERLGVKAEGPSQPVRELSGGNQQRLVLGKWLATEPRVLLLDEPTRGVDVGARAEIHELIDQLVQSGIGILMISSDLPEVLSMSDRILVLREGRVSARFDDAATCTAEQVMAAATSAEATG